MKLNRLKTITEFHRFMNLPKPEHPLISVIDVASMQYPSSGESQNILADFYSVALKRIYNGKMRYGQQEYDFDEGVMFFMAPGQVYGVEPYGEEFLRQSGWLLLIHPDFLWGTALAKGIRQYDHFDYSVHEALFLSDKEEAIIGGIFENIQQEYHSNIDKFSQSIIISQIETLLNYSERFYQRQFITRKITNHKILNQLEAALTAYFNSDMVLKNGLPSVEHVAGSLNVSPNYLSGLLKSLTGQSTQQHIHNKLIEKAKEKLSTTDLTVSEIAYELGFEHPQSFSKLFKTKTNLSPLAFRQSFS